MIYEEEKLYCPVSRVPRRSCSTSGKQKVSQIHQWVYLDFTQQWICEKDALEFNFECVANGVHDAMRCCVAPYIMYHWYVVSRWVSE